MTTGVPKIHILLLFYNHLSKEYFLQLKKNLVIDATAIWPLFDYRWYLPGVYPEIF